MSQFFASGGQNIGVSALASVPPMNIQDWPPLRWTGWISLQSKGLSRVFSNITVQKHQFFSLSFLYSPAKPPEFEKQGKVTVTEMYTWEEQRTKAIILLLWEESAFLLSTSS